MHFSLNANNTLFLLCVSVVLIVGSLTVLVGVVLSIGETGRPRHASLLAAGIGLVAAVGALIWGGTVFQADDHTLQQAAKSGYGVNLSESQARDLLRAGGAPNLQTAAGPVTQYGSTWAEVAGKRTRVTLYRVTGNNWLLGRASTDLHELTKP